MILASGAFVSPTFKIYVVDNNLEATTGLPIFRKCPGSPARRAPFLYGCVPYELENSSDLA